MELQGKQGYERNYVCQYQNVSLLLLVDSTAASARKDIKKYNLDWCNQNK